MKKKSIEVVGTNISVQNNRNEDYVCLTDMARYKNAEATGLVISHWLSTRYAIDFLGIWEQINNPDFNVTEFRNIRLESGSNGFVLSAKQWIEQTSATGIVSSAGRYGGTFAHKDIAFINQLICLSNLENLNAVFISEGMQQSERLMKLNKIAIQQMSILENMDERRLLSK